MFEMPSQEAAVQGSQLSLSFALAGMFRLMDDGNNCSSTSRTFGVDRNALETTRGIPIVFIPRFGSLRKLQHEIM